MDSTETPTAAELSLTIQRFDPPIGGSGLEDSLGNLALFHGHVVRLTDPLAFIRHRHEVVAVLMPKPPHGTVVTRFWCQWLIVPTAEVQRNAEQLVREFDWSVTSNSRE